MSYYCHAAVAYNGLLEDCGTVGYFSCTMDESIASSAKASCI